MPRFFFDVHGIDWIRDIDGREAPDLESIRPVAIAAAGRLIADNALNISLGMDWLMDVADETGTVVFQVALLAVTPPADAVKRKAA